MKNRKEIVRGKMIESAANEFACFGFEGANINTISEKAGFGKGTIYNYFKNKEDLLIEVIRFASNITNEKARIKISGKRNVYKKLYISIQTHFEFAIENESLLRVLIQEGYSSPSKIQKEIISAMKDCYELIIEIIREGKKQKIFSQSVDDFTAANILIGMLFHHDCTHWALRGKMKKKDKDKESKIIFNHFINGIKK